MFTIRSQAGRMLHGGLGSSWNYFGGQVNGILSSGDGDR